MTSIVNRKRSPRAERVELYHEPWEHELVYDELKNRVRG